MTLYSVWLCYLGLVLTTADMLDGEKFTQHLQHLAEEGLGVQAMQVGRIKMSSHKYQTFIIFQADKPNTFVLE